METVHAIFDLLPTCFVQSPCSPANIVPAANSPAVTNAMSFVIVEARHSRSYHRSKSLWNRDCWLPGPTFIELADEIGMIAMLAKRGGKGAVIPKGAVFLTAEPLENFQTVSSKFSQDRTRIM